MRKHMMTSMEACMLQLQLDNPLLVWKLPSFLNQLLFVQLEKGIFHSSILFSIRGCIDSIENWLPLTTSSSWKHSWRQLMTPSIWPTCMVRSLEPLKSKMQKQVKIHWDFLTSAFSLLPMAVLLFWLSWFTADAKDSNRRLSLLS